MNQVYVVKEPFFFFFFFNFLKKYFCHEEGAKGDVQKIIIDKIKQSAT